MELATKVDWCGCMGLAALLGETLDEGLMNRMEASE